MKNKELKVGTLVKPRRFNHDFIGLIVEVPEEDSYWGKTAVVVWLKYRERTGFREEITQDELEVINENR